MLDKKNVIFIPPLSDSLKELHVEYSTGDDQGKYEILDVANLAEANQLIPSIGPALILTSAAKTCALMLKANKKFIKLFRSKVILVTPQDIPNPTIEKLMTVGLSDYVQCPVAQKSLHYKCDFLLKSISGTQIEEDEKEEDQNFILESSKFDKNDVADNEKQRLEKGILEEHDRGELKKHQQADHNLNIINKTMDNSKSRGSLDLKLDFDEGDSSSQNGQITNSQQKDLELVNVKKNFELQSDIANKDNKPQKQEHTENDLTSIKSLLQQELEQEENKKKSDQEIHLMDGSPTEDQSEDNSNSDDLQMVKSKNKISANISKKDKDLLKLTIETDENNIEGQKKKTKNNDSEPGKKNSALDLEKSQDEVESQKKTKNNDSELGKKNSALDLEKSQDEVEAQKKTKNNDSELGKKNSALDLEKSQDEVEAQKKTKNNDSELGKKNSALDLEKANSSMLGSKKSNKDSKKHKEEKSLGFHKEKEDFSEVMNLDVMKGSSVVEHMNNKLKSKKHHGELKIDFEKKNRGEGETIDYSKIKKEYKELSQKLNSLSSDDIAKLKKKRQEQLYTPKKIYEPHSKGVEHLIKIYTIYEDSTKSSDDIITTAERIITEKFQANMALFTYNKESDSFTDRFQNFELPSADHVETNNSWKKIKLVNFEYWGSVNTPTWKDESFVLPDNEFIFPFFQDSTKQGFIVIAMNTIINANQTFLLEVILESLRGIVIEEYEEEMGNAIKISSPLPTDLLSNTTINNNMETKQDQPKKKKAGLLSRFFG